MESYEDIQGNNSVFIYFETTPGGSTQRLFLVISADGDYPQYFGELSG